MLEKQKPLMLKCVRYIGQVFEKAPEGAKSGEVHRNAWGEPVGMAAVPAPYPEEDKASAEHPPL